MGCHKETHVTLPAKFFTKTTREERLTLSDMTNHSVDGGGQLSCELSEPATKREAEQSAKDGGGLFNTRSKSVNSNDLAVHCGIENENDENTVWWEGNKDLQNPMNWSAVQRWTNLSIVSVMTFVAPLASSMFAPSVPQLMAEFNSTNEELASFVVSVYVLGFAVGPLVIAPCSEMYGRLILYHICNVLFLVFTVACAISPSLSTLIGFRFLAGCAGAAPLTLGGGTIADLVKQERRGVAMTLYTMGPLVGPIVGPMAGGYLAKAKGWRWVFWVLSVIGGMIVVVSFTCLRETYAPTILERKAERLRSTTGNGDLRSKLDSGLEPRQLFIRSIARPLRMLVLSPIILALSVFMALGYGYLYLLFTTFALAFEKQYEFGSGAVGLTYLGIGVGSMIGLVGVGAVSDRVLRKKSANGTTKPEYRLLPMIVCSPLMALGLFWYGWSANERVFWLVPIVGTSVFGIGLFATMSCITMYMVDAFTTYAASALAANAVLRSVFGAVLPLVGQKMYERLGLGWGNSILAFVALVMCPFTWILYRKGEYMRSRWSTGL